MPRPSARCAGTSAQAWTARRDEHGRPAPRYDALSEITPRAGRPDDIATYARVPRAEYLLHRDGARIFSGDRVSDPEVVQPKESWLARLTEAGFSLSEADDDPERQVLPSRPGRAGGVSEAGELGPVSVGAQLIEHQLQAGGRDLDGRILHDAAKPGDDGSFAVDRVRRCRRRGPSAEPSRWSARGATSASGARDQCREGEVGTAAPYPVKAALAGVT